MSLFCFLVPMAKACYRHVVVFPTAAESDNWKVPEWTSYLKENITSLPSEFLAFYHPEGSHCGEKGIRPHLHLIVKLRHSDPRYGDFRRLRLLFTSKILRHDTRAIKDLCSVCRYLQRGRHDFLHLISRPGCFYWNLLKQNQNLCQEPENLPPESLQPEIPTSFKREDLVKYLYDLWIFNGYTDSAALEQEQLTIKQLEFSRIMSMPAYENALTTAGKMFKASCQSITYNQHLLEYHSCHACMESVQMNSKDVFFYKWCSAQDVDPAEFLENCWKVLTEKEPKKATLLGKVEQVRDVRK